mmetsp:Transcript_50891/g.118900  ORF Transcript_50891/g.118900 Transcript_50891/m.118900 type:complete len:242 (-) Transcript_50891:627-1352(-)
MVDLVDHVESMLVMRSSSLSCSACGDACGEKYFWRDGCNCGISGAVPSPSLISRGEWFGEVEVIIFIIRCSEENSWVKAAGYDGVGPMCSSSAVNVGSAGCASSNSLIFIHMSISTSMSSEGTSFCSKAMLIVDAMAVMTPSPLPCRDIRDVMLAAPAIVSSSSSSSSEDESRSKSGKSSVINCASSWELRSRALSATPSATAMLGVAVMLGPPKVELLLLNVGRMRVRSDFELISTGESA